MLAALLGTDELALAERLGRLDKVHRWIETRGEEELPDGTLATRYRFAHVLYQNLLYEQLVSQRRIALHRQAGEQLVRHYRGEARRIAAPLAMHFERGRDFRQAVQYLIHAGDNAGRLYSSQEAEQYYTRALGLIEKLPPEEQPERRITIYQKRAAINHALCNFEQAIADFTGMLDQARKAGSPEREGAALTALAHTLFFAHHLDEVEACARAALRVAEASGSEVLRAEALALIGRRLTTLGDLAEATERLEESLRIAKGLDHKPALIAALCWRGLLNFFQSEYEPAEETLRQGLSLSRNARDGFMVLYCLYFLGLTLANLGRISEALAAFDEAMTMAQRNGDRNQSLKIPNATGWIYRELGDLDHAIECDQEGLAIARQHRVLEAEINSAINLGYDYAQSGDSEKTASALCQAEALLQRDEWLRWRFNLRLQAGRCEHLLARGECVQAEACARGLLETAKRHQARKYVATAHRLLSEVAMTQGDLLRGKAELKSALCLLGEYPAPLVAWKTWAALGRLHEQSGDRQAAREAFTEAGAIIKRIAASIADEKLRNVFLKSAPVQAVLS